MIKSKHKIFMDSPEYKLRISKNVESHIFYGISFEVGDEMSQIMFIKRNFNDFRYMQKEIQTYDVTAYTI